MGRNIIESRAATDDRERMEGAEQGKEIVTVHRRRKILKSYSAVMTGLVALLIGAAGVGLFLVFAGEGAVAWAGSTAVASAVILAGGLGLLVVVFHRRGGLLRSRVSREERAAYRKQYRGGAPEGDSDSSRTRRV